METDHLCIGGGPAGVFAALTAAANGKRCMILEHNKQLGRKLRITGKGRCNLTNNCDRDTLLANIPANGKFLYSALSRCTPQDVMAYFEGLGVPLKTERGNRVFPVSDRAEDIVQALQKAVQRAGIPVVHGDAAHLILEQGRCLGVPHRRRQRVPGWDNAPRHRRTFLPQDRLRRHRLSSGRRGRSHHRAAYALADPVGHQRELVPGCHGAFPAERDPAAVPGRKMRL